MSKISFKKLMDSAIVPNRGSDFAAGYDLCSTEDYTLQPLERKLFKTGIAMAIPFNMYGRVAPRSGLAYKNGLDVMAGVIDEDYRGDVGVILINLGNEPKEIKTGDKIAQIIFETYHQLKFVEVDDLPASCRGEGGFGSTDKEVPESTLTPKNFKEIVKGKPEDIQDNENSLANLYQKAGGIPIKQKYSDEVKERI